jgi:hypothetical protein
LPVRGEILVERLSLWMDKVNQLAWTAVKLRIALVH